MVLFVSLLISPHVVCAADQTTLKASCFLPKNHPVAVKVFAWIDMMNEGLKGDVAIKYVGGPEVVPVFEQIEAVKKGITHVSFTAGAHYATQLPAANSLHLSRLTAWGERESGYYDLMVEEHEKLGVRYLGRWYYGPFYVWLKEPVKTPDDLKGKRLRTHPLYDRFYKSLGIAGVTIQPTEVYTSLERGVVDGTSWPIQGPREQGWTRSLKYIINHPFYGSNNTVIVMNLDAWNKLPDDVKSKIETMTASFEREMVAYYQEQIKKEWGLLNKDGIETITFSESDAKRFLDLAYDVEWAQLEKTIPELTPKLRQTSGN